MLYRGLSRGDDSLSPTFNGHHMEFFPLHVGEFDQLLSYEFRAIANLYT